MKTISIAYDEDYKVANVVDVEALTCTSFSWNNNFEIDNEVPETDCEDFNDNARWLVKTLLAILKLEKEDDLCHCDWSADYDVCPSTGRYRFKVVVEKIKELDK